MITLRGSMQEMFDVAYSGLCQQNKKSYTNGVGCSYRDENGNKCGVGQLIKDEEYIPRIEGKKISSLLDFSSDIITLENNTRDKVKFLQELQYSHDIISIQDDAGSFNEQLNTNFANLAKRFSLNFTPQKLVE